jgi:hypothetical protein
MLFEDVEAMSMGVEETRNRIDHEIILHDPNFGLGFNLDSSSSFCQVLFHPLLVKVRVVI